jgi:hydroxymethylpyrimidine pyrophosphatase-like HAD family hydrolase
MESKKIFLFLDLDDTLIQAKRDTDFSKESLVGAVDRDGEVSAYIYRERKDFLDKIIASELFEIIPTTERNFESYSRTIFFQKYQFRYAILNFSATTLIGNKIDLQWKAHIDQQYSRLPIKVFEILQLIEKRFSLISHQLKNLPKVSLIDGYYILISFEEFAEKRDEVKKIGEIINSFMMEEKLNSLFYVYKSGNNYGILPTFLNKRYAVQQFIQRHRPFFTIGMGDNISDLGFMDLTDFSMLPNNSTLHKIMNRDTI